LDNSCPEVNKGEYPKFKPGGSTFVPNEVGNWEIPSCRVYQYQSYNECNNGQNLVPNDEKVDGSFTVNSHCSDCPNSDVCMLGETNPPWEFTSDEEWFQFHCGAGIARVDLAEGAENYELYRADPVTEGNGGCNLGSSVHGSSVSFGNVNDLEETYWVKVKRTGSGAGGFKIYLFCAGGYGCIDTTWGKTQKIYLRAHDPVTNLDRGTNLLFRIEVPELPKDYARYATISLKPSLHSDYNLYCLRTGVPGEGLNDCTPTTGKGVGTEETCTLALQKGGYLCKVTYISGNGLSDDGYEYELTLEDYKDCHKTDLNPDGAINILDIFIPARAFGSDPKSARWNPIADIKNDKIVNILDIFQVARQFNNKYECKGGP
jgi:hypothetical protein